LFNRATVFFGIHPTALRCTRWFCRNPRFGFVCGTLDHFNQPLARNVTIANLMARFVTENDNRALFRPFLSRDAA
jgi:hypothetical protein